MAGETGRPPRGGTAGGAAGPGRGTRVSPCCGGRPLDPGRHPLLHQILTSIVVRMDHIEHILHSHRSAKANKVFNAEPTIFPNLAFLTARLAIRDNE